MSDDASVFIIIVCARCEVQMEKGEQHEFAIRMHCPDCKLTRWINFGLSEASETIDLIQGVEIET